MAKGLLFAAIAFSLVSCDKDFNTIGSNIVDEDYFNFDKAEYEVVAYDSITGPVQTNNLEINSLGIYNNPGTSFGVSKSSFVTQVSLPSANVVIGQNPEIDSVWVYVPYFSTDMQTTDDDGLKVYELDSIHGNPDEKFRLKVYENGYFLEGNNPSNPNGLERYYSDDRPKIAPYLLGADASGMPVTNGDYLNNGPASENTQFYFNKSERVIYKTNGSGLYVDNNGVVLGDQADVSLRVVKERFKPGMWLNLNKTYVENRILKTSSSNLVNNNVFKNHFRGLYFDVEEIAPGQGAMAMLDFSKGYIRINYKVDGATSSAPKISKRLTLGLSGNTINFFENPYALPAGNDTRLYVKGGHGSVAYVKLFGDADVNGNGIPDELDEIKAKGWLINEANLVFHVDQEEMKSPDGAKKAAEPNRIYLYDAKNKRPIADYFADGSISGVSPKNNKLGFSGIAVKEKDGDGDKRVVKYKFRITEYLKSCIENDSTNFKLGVVVTENINTYSNTNLKPASPGEQPKRIVPTASAMHQLGTILHSPTSTETEKRLRLEIYYTKPD